MRKVLLIHEDYQEVSNIESVLKKIGFDVTSVRSDYSVSEKLMIFNPNIILAQAMGNKVNGSKMVSKYKQKSPNRKVILFAKTMELEQLRDRKDIDGFLEWPAKIPTIIETVSGILGLDAQPILDKYQKFFKPNISDSKQSVIKGALKAENQKIHVSGNYTQSKEEEYKSYLSKAPLPKKQVYKKEMVNEEVKAFRARGKDPEIQDIDELRRDFVRNMFKKNKS